MSGLEGLVAPEERKPREEQHLVSKSTFETAEDLVQEFQ
jgi:hypothetical protein